MSRGRKTPIGKRKLAWRTSEPCAEPRASEYLKASIRAAKVHRYRRHLHLLVLVIVVAVAAIVVG